MEPFGIPSLIASVIITIPQMLAVYLSYKLSKKVLAWIYRRHNKVFFANLSALCSYVVVSAILILLSLGISTGILQVTNDVVLWISYITLGMTIILIAWIFGLFLLIRNSYTLHKGRSFME